MAFAICLTANAGKKITKIEFSDESYVASYNSYGSLKKLSKYYPGQSEESFRYNFSYPDRNVIIIETGSWYNNDFVVSPSKENIQFNPSANKFAITSNIGNVKLNYELTKNFCLSDGKKFLAAKWDKSSITQIDELLENYNKTKFKYSTISYSNDWPFDWMSFILNRYNVGDLYLRLWYCNNWYTPFSKLPQEVSEISNDNDWHRVLKFDYFFYKGVVNIEIKRFINDELKSRETIKVYFE